MKAIPYTLTILILNLIFGFNALAENTTDDNTDADKAIESFYTAVKNKDLKSVDAILSPKIKKYITDGKCTIEEYVEAWNKHPIIETGKATEATAKDGTTICATAKIVFLLEGNRQETYVELVKVDNRWLWNSK